MKTNIDLDERLIREAQRLTGLPSKRAVVERALETLIRLHDQAQVRRLRGKLEWEGDLTELRGMGDGDPG